MRRTQTFVCCGTIVRGTEITTEAGLWFGSGTHPSNYAVYAESGCPAYEIYYNARGEVHRGGGLPAVRAWYPNGQLKHEQYAENGRTHRAEGPANIHYDPCGTVAFAQYCDRGALLREEKNLKRGRT